MGYPGWGHGVAILGSSIMTNGATGIEIYHNTFVNCSEAGVGIHGWGTSLIENNTIANNLFYDNDANGDSWEVNNRYQIFTEPNYAAVHPNTYKNNLLYSSSNDQVVAYGRVGVAYEDTHYNVTEFNAFNGTSGDNISGNFFGDADLFVNYTAKDYHLKNGVNAINAGVTIASRTTDYDGDSIVGLPDVGAYEYS
jgi:hypothetical protein